MSALDPFKASAVEVLAYREEHGISLHNAKNSLLRKNLHKAAEAATNFDEIKPVVRALVGLINFRD